MLKIEDPRPITLPLMPPRMKRILLEVCDKHDVHPNELISKDMCDKYVLARAEFYVRCRCESDYSYPRIGKAINKDHTTVLHSVKKFGPDHVFVPIKIKRPAFKSYLNGVLTKRQKEMIKMEMEGHDLLEMAAAFNLSDEVAKRHLRAAHQKMTARPQIRKMLASYRQKETPQAGELATLS